MNLLESLSVTDPFRITNATTEGRCFPMTNYTFILCFRYQRVYILSYAHTYIHTLYAYHIIDLPHWESCFNTEIENHIIALKLRFVTCEFDISIFDFRFSIFDIYRYFLTCVKHVWTINHCAYYLINLLFNKS